MISRRISLVPPYTVGTTAAPSRINGLALFLSEGRGIHPEIPDTNRPD
ncbi:hypothetical protein [Streptomyces sp. NPDC054784]